MIILTFPFSIVSKIKGYLKPASNLLYQFSQKKSFYYLPCKRLHCIRLHPPYSIFFWEDIAYITFTVVFYTSFKKRNFLGGIEGVAGNQYKNRRNAGSEN